MLGETEKLSSRGDWGVRSHSMGDLDPQLCVGTPIDHSNPALAGGPCLIVTSIASVLVAEPPSPFISWGLMMTVGVRSAILERFGNLRTSGHRPGGVVGGQAFSFRP